MPLHQNDGHGDGDIALASWSESTIFAFAIEDGSVVFDLHN